MKTKAKKSSKLTLSRFLWYSFLFVAILPSILLGIYQTFSSGWALEYLEEKDLLRSLRSASMFVESYLDNQVIKTKTLAKLIEALPIWYPEEVEELMHQFIATDRGIREWRLINSVGITVASYPTPLASTDYYNTTWFKKMLKAPRNLVITKNSELYFQKSFIGIAVPLAIQGNFAGLILGFVELDALGDILIDTINYPVILTDAQGFNLYSRGNQNEGNHQLNSLFVKGVKPFIPNWVSEEDGQYLSAYNTIPNYNWSVVVEKPRAEITKHWLERLIIAFLGVGLMAAFFLALLPWFERLIFKPFYNLHRAFRSINEYGILTRIEENQEVKEFQDIAKDFNAMVKALQSILKEMDRNFIAGIESLSKAIEFRDKYTGGHSQRVADYAVLIATQMEFDNKEIERIHIAGLLHDIGKIGVPGAILNKPGSLTQEEWQRIKRHPLIAVDILSGGPFKDLIPHIRSHHERFDGKGYPDGLKADEITLVAQILGVADAFDSMTSDRIYRPKIKLEEAKQELLKNRGTQFAPQVVDCMVRIIDNRLLTEEDDFIAKAVN